MLLVVGREELAMVDDCSLVTCPTTAQDMDTDWQEPVEKFT